MKIFWMTGLLGLIALGCGTQTGNPSKPTIVMPEIKYELPTSVTGSSNLLNTNLTADSQNLFEALAADACTSVFHCKAKRSHDIVRDINAIVQRVRDTDKVQSEGSFTKKGPNGRISGKLEINADAEYKYSATMCFDSNVFFHMKWSESGDKLVVTRDLQASPLGVITSREGKSRVSVETDSEKTDIDITLQSEWERPNYILAGDNLIERLQSTVYADDKSVELRAISDWYDNAPSSFVGNQYVVGSLNGDGTGEFTAYIQSLILCPRGFDENASDLWTPNLATMNPRWCFGRPVAGGGNYNDAEFNAALLRLEPIGILKTDALTEIEFDDGLNCE